MQGQQTVTTYLSSKPLLPLCLARYNWCQLSINKYIHWTWPRYCSHSYLIGTAAAQHLKSNTHFTETHWILELTHFVYRRCLDFRNNNLLILMWKTTFIVTIILKLVFRVITQTVKMKHYTYYNNHSNALLRYWSLILVRGLNPYSHLNCSNRSTSTKFGPHVAKVIYFRFFAGAKLGSRRGRHIGQIQDGRHS